eukprot:scaffold517_cov255-Pinguiococcus_pyrenoidosus.AAC.33
MQTTFNVEMSCKGCAAACTRILNKVRICKRLGEENTPSSRRCRALLHQIDGVENVDASVDDQKIVVTSRDDSDATPESMLAALEKWGESAGKTVSLAED